MQEYINGDIEKEGYKYVSTDPDFFTDADRAKVMRHLLCYEPGGSGDPSAPQRPCFWMVTTNLDKLGDPERLFLQESGPGTGRNTYYVHGYMSDPEETNLYGPDLLKQMRRRFLPTDQALEKAAKAKATGIMELESAYDDTLTAKCIDKKKLQQLLLAILDEKKVIVRLSTVGMEAARDAREFLLAIYQRLPYEVRRKNGFATGMTARKLLYDDLNPLPAAVTIILMDQDADTEEISSGRFQFFLDMNQEEEEPQALMAKRKSYEPLLEFLSTQPPERLDAYFQFCQSFMKNGCQPIISNYMLLIGLFQTEIGQDIPPEMIRTWAAALYYNEWQKQVRGDLHGLIRERLSVNALGKYALDCAASFDQLEGLGRISRRQEKSDTPGEKNQTLALALYLAEELYPVESAGLAKELSERFVEYAHQSYPCLLYTQPRAEDLKSLPKLETIQQGEASVCRLAEAVKKQTLDVLLTECESLRALHRRSLETQKAAGSARIRGWNFEEPIDNVYNVLDQYYLRAELMDAWNTEIGEEITAAYGNGDRKTMEALRALLDQMEANEKVFENRGGKFTDQQKTTITAKKKVWRDALALGAKTPQTVQELLACFAAVDGSKLNEALGQEAKESFVRCLEAKKPDRQELYENTPEICGFAARSSRNQALLRRVVESSVDVLVIPEGSSLLTARTRLDSIQKLAGAGLCDEMCVFQDWGVERDAGVLLERIRELETYRADNPKPVWENRQEQDWAAVHLQHQTDLMILLAKQRWDLRETIIPELSKRTDGVSAEQFEALYIGGCTRESLVRGAGTETAASWSKTAAEFFPRWTELPEPMPKKPKPEKQGHSWVIATQTALMGLIGVIPACAVWIVEPGLRMGYAYSAAILAGSAIGCEVVGCFLPEKLQKRLLRWQGAALVPGLIIAATLLFIAL